MIIGYARVSTKDQNLDMQIDALKKAGVERVFEEKVSGTKTDREQLSEALKILRKDDTFVVWKLDRLGRTSKQLIELVEQFDKDGVHFISIQESIDTTTPQGIFMFKVLCAMAQMERDVIAERTKRGLESARARGRVGGRPPKTDKVKIALTMYDSGNYSITDILKATGISKGTLYNYVNERGSSKAEPDKTAVQQQENDSGFTFNNNMFV